MRKDQREVAHPRVSFSVTVKWHAYIFFYNTDIGFQRSVALILHLLYYVYYTKIQDYYKSYIHEY